MNFSSKTTIFVLSLICVSPAFGKNSELLVGQGPHGHQTQSKFPLHDLIAKVNGERVKGYIQIEAKKNKQSLEQTNRLGDTPLHTAVYTKNYSALEALIDAGSDVNALNPNTRTSPLFIAQANKKAPMKNAITALRRGTAQNHSAVAKIAITMSGQTDRLDESLIRNATAIQPRKRTSIGNAR